MRILWVGERPPLHLRTRAGEAAAQTFAALAADYEISLVCFEASRRQIEQARSLARTCLRAEFIPRQQGLPALRAAVAKQLQYGGIEMVHLASPDLLSSVPESWVGPIVADARATACRDIQLVSQASIGDPRRSAKHETEEAQQRRLRAAQYRRARVFLAGSIEERDALEAIIGAPWGIHIVPPGVAESWIEPLRVVAHPSVKRVLSVAGHLGDDEFEEISRFLREAFPKIAAAVPEARYALAGAGKRRKLRHLFARTPGAVLYLAEESPRLWARAGVFVAPWRSPELQVPMLQAMALGIPIAATPDICSGLAVLPGKHLLVGDTPAALAEAVIAIQTNRELALRLSGQARKLFKERYSLSVALAGLDMVYQHAVRRETRCALCS